MGEPLGAMRPVGYSLELRFLGLALAGLALSPALAQQSPVVASGVKVTLKVGEQKVLNVGLAMGLVCNDGTVVQAELRPTSATENELVLTGLKPGRTACRAGTANVSRSKLVNITVAAPSAQ